MSVVLFVVANALYATSVRYLISELSKRGIGAIVAPKSVGTESLSAYYYRPSYNAFAIELGKTVISGGLNKDKAYVNAVLNSLHPDLVCLMPDSHRLQIAFSREARKRGIPTLFCAACFETGNTPVELSKLYADKMATMGEAASQVRIMHGVDSNRLIATGIAHFDDLAAPLNDEDRDRLVSMGVNPEKRIVTFITENLSAGEAVRSLPLVRDAIARIDDDIQLVVKVHPGEPETPYIECLRGYPFALVGENVPLHPLLKVSAVVVVKFSTVGLEAMIAGKPVMVINLSGKSTPVPYVEEGAALGVSQSAGVEPALRILLYGGKAGLNAQAFVKRWGYSSDGQASKRIADLMERMIAESRGAI